MKKFSLQKMLLIVSAIAVVCELLCVGCGHVVIHDKEFCGDLGVVGAHCAHTLTPETRDVSKENWDKERIGNICVNSRGWTDTETSIDQFCTTTDLCDYETQQAVVRIRAVVKKALAARKKSGIDLPGGKSEKSPIERPDDLRH